MSTTTVALATAILTLETKLLPNEIDLVVELVNKIKGKKHPAAAVKAASKAVDAMPDDPNAPANADWPGY
jgi:hypothetical protein